MWDFRLQMRQELGFSNAPTVLAPESSFSAIPVRDPQQYRAGESWRQNLVCPIVLTWGIATVAWHRDRHDLVLYPALVIGAAEAGTAPGVMLYLSQWVPDSQRGRFNSLYWVSVRSPLSRQARCLVSS